MTDLEALKNELMKNPEFRAEYEALAPEYEIMRAMIDARLADGMGMTLKIAFEPQAHA